MTIARPDHRPATHWVFAAALLAGASFWPASHVAWLGQGALFVIWKTTGVALLALWAWLGQGALFVIWKTTGVALLALWTGLRARDRWGWLLVAVMAWGAIGDAVLETSQNIGGAAFLLGHVCAIVLYRSLPRPGGAIVGLVAMAIVMLTAWLLTRSIGVLLYATGLGGMLGAALSSRFPRRTLMLGAVFFAVSDLLIFAKMDVLANSPVPTLLIWPLYFAGQALVAYGASTFLESEPR